MISFEYISLVIVMLAFMEGYVNVAKRLNIVDVPHHQSSHTGKVIRGGGVIFYFAFFVWSFIHCVPYPWALIGLSILAGVSFIDDIHDVKPQIRLLCQFVAIIMMLCQTALLHHHYHVIFLLSIACVGCVNIYNFMDGINGMTGGYSLIVSLFLLYVNHFYIQFVDNSLLVTIILAIIVFNLYNFRTQAKCFAGDVGSLSIGFLIVFFVLELALKARSMSWLAFLFVYAVDGGLTIIHRILLKENLLKPHKKHAYQILANELKIPHLKVVGIYVTLQAICCIWYIFSPGYPTLSLQIILLSAIYLFFMRKYYHLHKE